MYKLEWVYLNRLSEVLALTFTPHSAPHTISPSISLQQPTIVGVVKVWIPFSLLVHCIVFAARAEP